MGKTERSSGVRIITLASCLPRASVSSRPEGSIACLAYKITRLGLRHGTIRSGPTSADTATGRLGVLARPARMATSTGESRE